MNAKEFKRVFNEANNDTIDWSVEYPKIDILLGCGLSDFKPAHVTLRTAAAHLRYQAMLLNGDWSTAELNECRDIFRKKVSLLD